MNIITDFFSNNFESCIWIAIILVAMFPTLESKIAIPLAMNSAIWGEGAFSPLHALLISFLGSILPAYLILIITRKIKQKTSLFLHSKIIQKYAIKSVQIERKASYKKYLSLCGFTAIPLPLTGVWSSSLIAGLSNLNIHYAFLSITIGSLISCGCITILCTVFNNSISAIFVITFLIIICYLIIDLFLHLIERLILNKKRLK